MKKTKIVLSALLVVVLAMSLTLTGCGKDKDKEKDKTETTATPTELVQNYVHVRFASMNPQSDADLKTTADAWMGIYQGNQAIAPTAYTKYSWIKIQGADGKDGVDGIGIDGKDGKDGIDGIGIDGKDGIDGKSAYQIAVDNGFMGTEAEWLESLQGKDGLMGIRGKSAYQIAVDDGFLGTEVEWLESLQGKDGVDGKDGDVASVELLSITRKSNSTTLNLKANKAGALMVAVQCYGHIIGGNETISVSRINCANVASQPDYFMINGVVTDDQSVLSVPIVPEVLFAAGDTFSITLNGYYVNYAIVNEAVY